jgi:hypothetical protein
VYCTQEESIFNKSKKKKPRKIKIK